MKVVNVVGARPNFVKIAPLMQQWRKRPDVEAWLLHTGQHYDQAMSEQFFKQLDIPRPDINLEVGSGSHAVQTAEVMKRCEPVLEELRPDVVVVVGDVNSTLAVALVAVKLGIRVAHVEAGLRSFDRSMPEEINRVLTDALADYCFITEPSGLENLKREGVDPRRLFLVGNVMIDALFSHRRLAQASGARESFGLHDREYLLLTLHRPSNVDDREVLQPLLAAVAQIDPERPLLWPMHPRTRARLGDKGLSDLRKAFPHLRVVPPLGYLEFLDLMCEAALVLTDSGGIQEETTALGVPCVTLRSTTERPVTVTLGTNVLAGTDPAQILSCAKRQLAAGRRKVEIPLWDGQAAARIATILSERVARSTLPGPHFPQRRNAEPAAMATGTVSTLQSMC